MPAPLAPWTPFADLDDLRRRLDRASTQWFDGEDRTWMPAIDIERGAGKLTVRADMPGVKPEDVNIEVQRGALAISGGRGELRDQKEKTYLRRERRYGSFRRSMAIPEGVDPSKIKAKTRDGVVEVTIPLPAEKRNERITITPTTG